MKLGAMDYIVAGRDDAAMFARAQRLGFAGVEVNVRRSELREDDAPRLGRLQAAMAASGLAIPALVLGEHSRGGVGSSDEAQVEAARQDLITAIEWAATLGIKVILVPFFGKGELITDQDIARAVSAFGDLCPLAQERGVRLCYEGTLPADTLNSMAAQIDSPGFGCYFDLAGAVWRGFDAATEIRRLGPLLGQVHMKEISSPLNKSVPGRGQVDFPSSAAALREVGYDGWLVLETPGGPDALVTRDISFTRRFFPIEWKASWPRFGAFSYGYERGETSRLIGDFREAGMTAVQLGSGLLEDAFENPQAIKAELNAAGIEIVAIAGYRNLTAPDLAQRQANIAFIKRCLEVAPLLGCEVVATETGTLNRQSEWAASPDNWTDEAWKAFYAALDELLPVAEQHGAILALEGYVNNVLITYSQLESLLERYPTRHLQVVLDPYNYLSRHLLPAVERVTQAFLERFEHRFVLAHLKDVGPAGAEIDTPEFGTGVFPQQPYLAFLRDRRPDLPLILEHLPHDHFPAAIQRVEAIIGGSKA